MFRLISLLIFLQNSTLLLNIFLFFLITKLIKLYSFAIKFYLFQQIELRQFIERKTYSNEISIKLLSFLIPLFQIILLHIFIFIFIFFLRNITQHQQPNSYLQNKRIKLMKVVQNKDLSFETQGNIQKHRQNNDVKAQIIEQENIKKSEFLTQYNDILANIKTKSLCSYEQNMKLHNINYSEKNDQDNCRQNLEFICDLDTDTDYKIVKINVIIGCFCIHLQICNMNFKKQLINIEKTQQFQGSFGQVYIWYYKERQYATKRFAYNSVTNKNYQSLITNIIFQYSYNKLFSALQIGPKSLKIRGFDIIIYKDCIEFDMERCKDINQLQFSEISNYKLNQIELYESLKLMHSLNIVHHDIKPANIMHSQFFNKFVFIDFGFTKTTKSKIGQKQSTLFVGSFNYVSDEMKQIVTKSSALVDLYWNDLHGLKISLNIIFQSVKKSIQLSHLSLSQDFQFFALEQNLSQKIQFYEIVQVLRTNYQNCEQKLEKITNSLKKQEIQSNYIFFLDFFLTLSPKKQIGFFCQRYLKNMIENNLNYKEKFNFLYQKGWPKTLYMPEWKLNPEYQERFQFFNEIKQCSANTNSQRQIKIKKKSNQQIKLNILQNSKKYNLLCLGQKFKLLKTILFYFKKQEQENERQTVGKKIFTNLKFQKRQDANICQFIECFLKLQQDIEDQLRKNKEFFITIISKFQYNQALFIMAQILLDEQYVKQCEKIIKKLQQDNFTLKNQIKIANLAIQCFQRMNDPKKAQRILIIMNGLIKKVYFIFSQDQLSQQNLSCQQVLVQPEFEECRYITNKFANIKQNYLYWKCHYLKNLAVQRLFCHKLDESQTILQECFQILPLFVNKPFYNKIYGNLLRLKASSKLNKNQVEQSLKLALDSNRVYSCMKRDNRGLAVYISNIYCILGDIVQARRYFKAANSLNSYQKDHKMYVLEGQICLLQFNSKRAQQLFDMLISKDQYDDPDLLFKLYFTFAGQFKGIQSHLFLLKYLNKAQQLLKTILPSQDKHWYFQKTLEIVENKFKFYIFLKQNFPEKSQNILKQVQTLLQNVQEISQQMFNLIPRNTLTQKYLFCKARIFRQTNKFQNSNQALKLILNNRKKYAQTLQHTTSIKQVIDCASLMIQNSLKQGKQLTNYQIKEYLQLGINFHLKFENLIFCLNSDSYTLNVLKYMLLTKQITKTVEVMYLVSLYVTKYRGERCSYMYSKICVNMIDDAEVEDKHYMVYLFSQKKSQKNISQGSQILVFIYSIYLKLIDLRYRKKCIQLLRRNMLFLGVNSRQRILNCFYKQCIEDLRKQNKLSSSKEFWLIRKHSISISNQNSISYLLDFIFKKSFKKYGDLNEIQKNAYYLISQKLKRILR